MTARLLALRLAAMRIRSDIKQKRCAIGKNWSCDALEVNRYHDSRIAGSWQQFERLMIDASNTVRRNRHTIIKFLDYQQGITN